MSHVIFLGLEAQRYQVIPESFFSQSGQQNTWKLFFLREEGANAFPSSGEPGVMQRYLLQRVGICSYPIEHRMHYREARFL